MDKIEDIRKRARGGEPIASIARAVGASEPTVRKRARMKDLSPEPPRRREPESEVLAPYEETVDSWLDDDCRNWRKQRHTATRACVRLRDEEGHAGSRSTARRHARRRREEMARERDRRDAEGFLALRWLPGEVQAGFGEADFRVRGVVTRGKYLTVTFPHSNVGLTQVFWGETAECVCQGLRNVLGFVGGVPGRAVLDNAAEVGGRVGGEARTSGLFRRFAAHYGLGHTSTNPCSGNEKGNVENKVGRRRRNLFVPVPSFHDARAFSRGLPEDCLDLSEGKRRCGLGTPGPGLFGEDREALSPLPPPAFVRDAEDLVFYGQTGRGKTHMATALGIAATSAGYPVRFRQTAQLVPRLGKAKREGTLDRLLADVAKARLLVLDEFGCVPFDVDGARLLCRVISDSYERRSVIFTANVEFSRWGTAFADDKLAAAIVDRVARHGRLVEFGGPSHRLEESLMLGKLGR